MAEMANTPGKSLRVLRMKAGLTLDQVAKEAGVSATHLSRVETGAKKATPAWLGAVTGAIAKALLSDSESEEAA
ncbi:helix-turn-helix domain-containing protein [Actinomycetaceae bacterium WB03_NA08]|uniref:Helix-turn-helix domain-containing protein n=1 Tax=Scrofimicrobium canadense TaxID=2652290 RepID=A0A6N7W540_9ACTO|nr:helix-turn-helix transcriptional regulator [Scrofimicrobium canadense]MSS84531.1 helix-turn-helix domain-containing protein [Scrofimicrobium canadense]